MTTPPRPRAEAIREFIEDLASSRILGDAIAYRRYVAGSPASFASPERPIDPALAGGLSALGVAGLYNHQAEALDAVRAGENVAVVTPTASGKSLIYMAPTIERQLASPGSKALYLYPYKALAQDQLRAFSSLAGASAGAAGLSAAIYDGDTPQDERLKIRASPPDVLITNPDMLHLAVLSHHPQWRRFLSALDVVVVDELHVYRGIFGSHLHHVMTRLRRICDHYGATPRFVACSATIGNPGAFAESLLGSRFRVVERSGAPRAGRHFLFVNSTAASPYTLATRIVAHAIESGLRTIAFTKARRITELIRSWLAESHPHLARRVSAYRAGYLPEERRDIEERLADGRLLGVVTTSALEHGIDIGGLDVCVLVGYPGSITSSWQRIGRVGRKEGESLVVLVAMQDALDQFFMTSPTEFFDRGFEPAAADPDNLQIASQHLVCAAAELPLTSRDERYYSGSTFSLVDDLTRAGALVVDREGETWFSLRRRPQRDVNLRSTGASYTIVEEPSGRVVGSVDGIRAFLECHEGAVYLHQGQQYEVMKLDRDRRRVEARRCDVDYYTQVQTEKETEILEVISERVEAGYVVRLGRIRVTQEFKAYHRRRIRDQQRLSTHPLQLPPLVYETVGMWIEIPGEVGDEMTERGRHFMGSLHASEHAAISLFPLLAICDRNDLGGISYPSHPQIGGPAVFVYDGYPGGIGLARQGFAMTESLLEKTCTLIGKCRCEAGCPSCIHSPKCGSGNHPLDKKGAVMLLERLLRPPAIASRPLPARILGGSSRAPIRPADPVALEGRAAAPASLPRRILFLDVETRRSAEEVGGWDRIRDMGLALAVVYDGLRDEYRTYFEQDVDRLAVHLLSAELVVGFNVKRFDYEVLGACCDADFTRVTTLDIMEEIQQRLGFRLSLGHLAEATLGIGKSADGLQSLQWFKEGRLDLIEDYCRQDVEVTRALFEFGCRHGHLLYLDREGRSLRLPISWSERWASSPTGTR